MDYMEKVIALVDINIGSNISLPIFNYSGFPFEFNSLSLPECNTGFVYFLVSISNKHSFYIGEAKCLRTRHNEHNSGFGTAFTNEI